MAAERHDIELQLQLDAFNENIRRAQANLKEIEKTSDAVGKNSSKALAGDPQETERATTGVERFNSALRTTGKIIAVTGGLLAGLKLFRLTLGAVTNDNDKAAASFLNFTRSTSTAVGSAAGMVRAFAGTTGAIDQVLGRIQRATVNTTVFSGALTTLRKNDSVKAFASDFNANFDKAERRLKDFLLSIPGVRQGLAALGTAAQATGKKLRQEFPNFIGLGKLLGEIGDGFFRISAGAAGVAPGIGKAVSSLDAMAVSAGVVGSGLQAMGVNAGFLGSVAGGVTFAIAGLNAAIGALGVVMSSVGQAIISTTSEWALAAGRADLAFQSLEASLANSEDRMGKTLGSIDEFKSLLDELSTLTGFSIDRLTEMAFVFTNLAPEIGLTADQLPEIIRLTAITGKRFGDLSRATIAVKDAFTGVPGPALRLLGVNLKQKELAQLTARAMQVQADATQGVSNSQKKAIQSQQVFNKLMEGAAPLLDTLNEKNQNLVIQNQRLTGAVQNAAIAFGRAAAGGLSQFLGVITGAVNALTRLPEPVINIIGQLASLAGIALTVVGTLIKLSTAFILVFNANRILNALLTTNLPLVGQLGVRLTQLTANLTGVAPQITGLASALRAVGLIFTSTFGEALGSVLKFSKSLFDAKNVLRLLIAPVAGVGIAIKAVATAIGVLVRGNGAAILSFGKSITIIGLLVGALFKLDEKYKIIETTIGPVIRAVKEFIENSTVVEFVVAKVAQAIEVGLVVALGFLEAAALGIVAPISFVIKLMRGAAFAVDSLAHSLFGLDIGLSKIGEGTDEVLTAITTELRQRLVDTGKEALGLSSKLFSMDTTMGNLAKRFRKTGKDTDDLVVEFKTLAEIIKTTSEGITEGIEGTSEALDRQIEQLRDLAEAEKQRASATISAELQREKEIIQIERRLQSQTIEIADQKLQEVLKRIDQREKFELDALKKVINNEKATQEDRIKAESDVLKKNNQERVKALNEFRGLLTQELSSLRQQQAQRVQAIREAELAIRNLHRQTQEEINKLRRDELTDQERQREVEDQIRQKEFEAAGAISRGDLDSAKNIVGEIKTLFGEIPRTAATSQEAIATTARIAAASTLDEARALTAELQRTLTPSAALAKVGFEATIGNLDGAKKAAEALGSELSKSALAGQRMNVLEPVLTRIRDLEIEIQEKSKQQLQAQQDADKNRIATIQQQITEIDQKILEVREKLAQPVETLVQFTADRKLIDTAIQELRNMNLTIPVTFVASKIDIKGGSIHSLAEAGNVIRQLLNPGLVNVALGTNPIPPALTQAGAVAQQVAAPTREEHVTKTVRVELQLGDKTAVVNTQSEEDADALVGFTRQLQTLNRTRGNYVSPFTR